MMRWTAFAGALALALFSGAPIGAAEPASSDADVHRIRIVNGYGAPMIIYAEDAEGALHEVAELQVGEVRFIDTDVEGRDGVRLHARPTNSRGRHETWGDQGLVTDALEWSEDETAVLWIAAELAESLVEIRVR